jgi:ElaB/YqjD/DUF883 family membrane-anchored ribosome-binding protein
VNTATKTVARVGRSATARYKAERGLLRHFVDDVEELVKSVVDVPGVDLAAVRGRVSGALEDARAAVESGAETVRDSAHAGADAADEYVRGHPWVAVGVAIGIGILLGFSTRR